MSDHAAQIDAIVQEAMRVWQVPGASLAVVRGDEVVHLKGYGVRERDRDEPVTPDTLFAIGSTTKAITTTAMAMLVDDGKIVWDDPVRRHLPSFRLSDPLADANVTLRDLVCHRTGLSRHDMLWYGSPWDREEILRRIGRVKLGKSFRSVLQYQNIFDTFMIKDENPLENQQVLFMLDAGCEVSAMHFLEQEFKKVRAQNGAGGAQ